MVGNLPVPCVGQSPSLADGLTGPNRVDTLQQLQQGIRLVQSGHPAQAVRRLRPLFDASPGYTAPERGGTLAYWLGKAYEAQEQSSDALSVWRSGVSQRWERHGDVDYRLADAFIQEAFEQRSWQDHKLAVRTYLRFLRQLDRRPPAEMGQAVVRRPLREVAVVLPEHIQARTGLTVNPRTLEIEMDRTANAGEVLAAWWRGQDPLPATRQNERVREHLRRVAYARTHYTHEGQMDDRGKVYIRYGKPRRDVSIGMENNETVSAIATNIRRNEFWTYRHVHRMAYFLFVEKNPEVYDLGGVSDLFPPDMKTGLMGSTSRARDNALEYLYTMEEALRELSTFHEDYLSLATEAFDRAAWARDNEEFGIGSDPVEGSPGNFLMSMEPRIDKRDDKTAKQRAEKVPPSYTTVSEDIPDLPIASRTARLLTPDGKTKVEVYWSVPLSALGLTEEVQERIAEGAKVERSQFALFAATVQEAPNHVNEVVRYRRYLVRPSSEETAILEPRTFTAKVEDSLFHVATQWDQKAIRRSTAEDVEVGSVLRRHTERYDTLAALNSDPSTLEMSDLKLLTVPDEEAETAITSEKAIPYPFDQVKTTQPLALSFEVYHLHFDAEDRTRYTVSYETWRETEKKGIAGLFGGTDEEQTTTTTTHQGDSRRTQEYIMLDLENLIQGESGTVRVTVGVKDEVTGQTVTRSIEFKAVVPGSG